MFMDYPKEVILNINNSSLISSNEFKSLVNEIIKKQNIVSLTVYFNKNYFTFGRNSKKMFVAIKESNPSMDEIFVKFRDITFEIFNDAIKLENLGYNFEDFFNNIDNLENNKLNYNYVNNIEISFCFSEQKKKQLDNCLSFLNNSLINKNINSATKDKLFNFVGFNKEMLSDFIVKQKNLIDLRICGNMGEDEMELIINKYYDILTNNENNDYKIKKISLNGPIHMNEKWKNLICNFLKLKQIEAFHVDCFFNEREYMRDIAEAFIDNTTMKSFAVRNTCRPPKDYFPEVLKEALYNRKIPRKEVFIKIKLYKLL
jgi:hypothetical protein